MLANIVILLIIIVIKLKSWKFYMPDKISYKLSNLMEYFEYDIIN